MPKSYDEAMQDDIAELLRILGLGDHARPKSSHAVMQGEIIPKIKALVVLRDGMLRNAGGDIPPGPLHTNE